MNEDNFLNFVKNKKNIIFMEVKNIKKKMYDWWHGTIPEDDSDSNIFILGPVYTQSSIIAHNILDYLKREYKFIIRIILTIIAIIISFYKVIK